MITRYTDQTPDERRTYHAKAAMKSYYKNPERAKARHRNWLAAHPAAGERASRKRSDAAAKSRETAEWFLTRPIKGLLAAARKRAKEKGLPHNLAAGDFLPLPTHCPILGLSLRYGPGVHGRSMYANKNAASLDRIHNELGYVKGNVIIVSLRANLLKGQASIDELQKIASFYRRLQS